MLNIEELTNDIEKFNKEVNLLESKKIKYKAILVLIENENIEKIKKKNFFLNNENKINYNKIILENIKNQYENDYNILYLLDYNLNLELNVLEDLYNNNYSLNYDEFKEISYNNKIFNLNIIKNLNNNNNNNNNTINFTDTDSIIIILKKKDKIYYIKNKKEKKNKTKKIQK